jgi:hypothetical protein
MIAGGTIEWLALRDLCFRFSPTKTAPPQPARMSDKPAHEAQSGPKTGGGAQLAVVNGGAAKKATMTEEERLAKMAEAARTLLECMGEDPTRPGLLDTPMRMAKAMSFFTQVSARALRGVAGAH